MNGREYDSVRRAKFVTWKQLREYNVGWHEKNDSSLSIMKSRKIKQLNQDQAAAVYAVF